MEIIKSLVIGIIGVVIIMLICAAIIYFSPEFFALLLGLGGLAIFLALIYIFGVEIRESIKEWKQ